MIDIEEPVVSVRRQCELLGLKRSSFYYQATPEASAESASDAPECT